MLAMLQGCPSVALQLADTSGLAGDMAGHGPQALRLQRFSFRASWPNFRWGSGQPASAWVLV